MARYKTIDMEGLRVSSGSGSGLAFCQGLLPPGQPLPFASL